MSSKYYFEKWKNTLHTLCELTQLDMQYQDGKVHDTDRCEAAARLTGVLGNYMFIYNEMVDCYQHNLQVQKTEYIIDIIKAVVARILELKEQLRKLLVSVYQFMGHGIIDHKLTVYDAEVLEVAPKTARPENVKTLVLEALQKAKKRQERIHITDENQLERTEEKISPIVNWWDSNTEELKEEHKGINVAAVYELKKPEVLTIEMLERKKMVTLIQTHERSRKVVFLVTQRKHKMEKWIKELKGTLKPPARVELREHSARLIQRVCRAYFEIKRKKNEDCKRDELLDLRLCKQISYEEREKDIVKKGKSLNRFKNYESIWNDHYNKIKLQYVRKKQQDIEDDIREEIMQWFRHWFDTAVYFYDIPKENVGGSNLIVNETILSPVEWLEKYEAYLEQKRINKNKTTYDLKREKMEAKKEKLMQKKAALLKKKAEGQLQKKMMKNPNYQPRYYYPESKKMECILEGISKYKRDWSYLDILEVPGITEKFVPDVDVSNAYMSVKMQLRKTVDEAMRETLKMLKRALREDYERNGEKMPEEMKERKRNNKKKSNLKLDVVQDTSDKLEDLAIRGFLKDYPETKIEHFIGDPNFAGEDLRCMLQPAQAFHGEMRTLWWEKCCELSHTSSRILIVGPKGNGKTTLVYAMASVNDAVFYEIDPEGIPEELLSATYLQQLADSIAACARATQPSVIYIKHVDKLYYTKALPDADKENLNLIKRYLIRKLIKKIHKAGKIVIIASCAEPWLANSKQLLKQFPSVVLLPETNYSVVSIILRNWVLNNHIVPNDLDIQSLAYVLCGYSFSHIKDTLTKFLTADRIIKIAARGMTVGEIYDFFLEDTEEKVDYNKYIKWYNDKSPEGKKEKKFLEKQKEFQMLLAEMQEKLKKKNNADSATTVSSDIEL